jgi:polyisoprenoid-binding protein YceI
VHYEPEKLGALKIAASIDVASISTRDAQRDGHLKSADFFDVEKFPTMTFVSKHVTPKAEGALDLVGDLTVHGTTHEVTLAVSEITPEHKDPWGNIKVGATAATKIRRSDFGMVWNAALEAGGVLVGDDVKIQLEIELTKNK